MRLEGIQPGDIVEVDHKGRRFHALVIGSAPGGLALAPTDRRVNYYSCRSREVIGHWAKRGRPKQTSEPLRPSPRQLEMDLASGEADLAVRRRGSRVGRYRARVARSRSQARSCVR